MSEGHVCIAGYADDGSCIRPIFNNKKQITDSWLNKDGCIIKPFNKIQLRLLQKQSDAAPHTEDWIVDETYRIPKGKLSESEQKEYLSHMSLSAVSELFGAPIYNSRWVKPGTGFRSIGTIKAMIIKVYSYNYGKWKMRLVFIDESGISYDLPITDLAFQEYGAALRERYSSETDQRLTTILNNSKEVYLRIGLGRPFKSPSMDEKVCYLQINGIYHFPKSVSH